MKFLKLLTLTLLVTLSSCSSFRVSSDYDTNVNFKEYKTFAFYKKGIDRADVSDLDKKRILRAIEFEMLSKGFKKSDDPDILVSIFTKSKEKININNNSFGFGWGWGWNPWAFGGLNNINVNQYTEGTLFIDFIDKEAKHLIWQGIGSGLRRVKSVEKKEKGIKELVTKILSKFPPSE